MKPKKSMIDELGNRYGMLVVVSRGPNASSGGARWVCSCDCGGMTTVEGGTLRSGNTISCGCARLKYEDMTGFRVGRLTVIGASKIQPTKSRDRKWDCVCECGNFISVSGNKLRNNQRSCGCIGTESLVASNSIRYKKYREARGLDPNILMSTKTQMERAEYGMSGVRKECFKRDGYACKRCGLGGKLNAHHILSWKDHPDRRYDLSNLITLCESCHKNHVHKGGFHAKVDELVVEELLLLM